MTPQLIGCNAAALFIATVYYFWRDVYIPHRVNRRLMRERVTYMLWVAANR